MSADLTVYHTNDMHNHSAVLDLLHRMRRAEPSLLLDSGDAIRGSNTVFHWSEPILSRMQRTGYHAMAMGNREQHYLRFVQRLRAHERGFPILAANLIDLHHPEHDLWQSSLELEVGGIRVGLMGATPPQYPTGSHWEQATGLRFEDPWECLPSLAEELRPRCDLLIFISHLGLRVDRELAPSLPGVDLIVGGHSHDLLPEPEKVASSWLVQVGCYGRYLGAAGISLNPLRLEYKLLDTALPEVEMILLVSNGAGEDSIGASLAAHLGECQAFPLVGSGAAYLGRVPVVGPAQQVPSQGLARESWRLMWADLKAGLVGQVLRQLRFLRLQRSGLARSGNPTKPEGVQVVCVGDLLPVILAVLAGHRRLFFVGTAKSVWHHGYSWPERWILRRFCRLALVRDEPTAARLRSQGVNARWVGNAMMDQLAPQGLPMGGDGPCLALFPGSRQATYAVLPRLLEVCARIGVNGLVALADSVDVAPLVAACSGWTYEPAGLAPGVVGWLTCPVRVVAAAPLLGPVRVGLVRGALGDLLAHCQVALGQAGTAHEQAAGAGVPVVATGRLGWYRGRQKGLLGDALEVVDTFTEAAAAVDRLLGDDAERARRGAVGRERMGPPGGTARMAEAILSL